MTRKPLVELRGAGAYPVAHDEAFERVRSHYVKRAKLLEKLADVLGSLWFGERKIIDFEGAVFDRVYRTAIEDANGDGEDIYRVAVLKFLEMRKEAGLPSFDHLEFDNRDPLTPAERLAGTVFRAIIRGRIFPGGIHFGIRESYDFDEA